MHIIKVFKINYLIDYFFKNLIKLIDFLLIKLRLSTIGLEGDCMYR